MSRLPFQNPNSINAFQFGVDSMTRYIRSWNCSCCGKPVIYDNQEQTINCGCGKTKATFINLTMFKPLPKYDRNIYDQKIEVPIDAAKFVDPDTQTLWISDVNSIFKGNENPRLVLSYVYYPKDDKTQLKLAVKGKFHMEKLCYNLKDPHSWTERLWIMIPIEQIDTILKYVERNPHKLASWC